MIEGRLGTVAGMMKDQQNEGLSMVLRSSYAVLRGKRVHCAMMKASKPPNVPMVDIERSHTIGFG